MPIEGHGDVASGIVDNNKFLFFAAGVSNSKETNREEFDRERKLLLSQDKNAHIVYFSTLSVFYADTAYTRHKRDMEGWVRSFHRYTVVRLGNIAFGRNNPHTLINFLRTKIEKGEPFEIQNVYRYILTLEEYQHWLNLIPWWSCEMNIPGRRMLVSEIVDAIRRGTL